MIISPQAHRRNYRHDLSVARVSTIKHKMKQKRWRKLLTLDALGTDGGSNGAFVVSYKKHVFSIAPVIQDVYEQAEIIRVKRTFLRQRRPS